METKQQGILGLRRKKFTFINDSYFAPLELTGKSVCIFYYDVAPTGQEE